MTNPHEYGTSQWAAWEKDQADKGHSTGSAYNASLRKRDEDARRSEQELQAAQQRLANNNGCFSADTKILTPFGLISIDSIKKGDHVVCLSESRAETSNAPVLKVVRRKKSRIYSLTLACGTVIRTTRSHSFLTPRGWQRADEIAAGETIHTHPDGWKKVEQSSQTGAEEPTYNLIVDRTYTFIADGAVAHSFTSFRSARCVVWNIISITSQILQRASRSPEKLLPS